MILNSGCILIVIEEEKFEDDNVKVLKELAFEMNRDGANIIVELHSR